MYQFLTVKLNIRDPILVRWGSEFYLNCVLIIDVMFGRVWVIGTNTILQIIKTGTQLLHRSQQRLSNNRIAKYFIIFYFFAFYQ